MTNYIPDHLPELLIQGNLYTLAWPPQTHTPVMLLCVNPSLDMIGAPNFALFLSQRGDALDYHMLPHKAVREVVTPAEKK